MQDEKQYAIGVDIGTSSVKVVAAIVKTGGAPSVVGAVEKPISGLRKGSIVNPNMVAETVDKALIEVQQISGTYISHATVNINGAHIAGCRSDGVVSVTGSEVVLDDLLRAEETARIVNLPPNRTILDILPQSYTLDQHVNIKNPLGMKGVRLEVDAYITTALTPHVEVLMKTLEAANLKPNNIEISGLAAAQAVLTDSQRERGVVLADIGAATTNVVVYEEGELRHVGVIPVGGDNITDDLATVLMIDWDAAEELKLQHAHAVQGVRENFEALNVKSGNTITPLDPRKVDMVVEARVEAIFEAINDELRKIDRFAKLPGGVVITGGVANLQGIVDNARQTMRLHAKVAYPPKISGLTDKVTNTKFVTCLGLMLVDAENGPPPEPKKSGVLGKIFARNKKS
jgi:cell division protein FtsA